MSDNQSETETGVKPVLSPLKSKVMSEVERMLRGVGATYHIKLDDFEVNTIPAAPEAPARKKRNLKYPMGTLTNYVRPYLENLPPGGMAVIPFGEFPQTTLRATITAVASNMWGNDSYISATTEDELAYEILRR